MGLKPNALVGNVWSWNSADAKAAGNTPMFRDSEPARALDEGETVVHHPGQMWRP